MSRRCTSNEISVVGGMGLVQFALFSNTRANGRERQAYLTINFDSAMKRLVETSYNFIKGAQYFESYQRMSL